MHDRFTRRGDLAAPTARPARARGSVSRRARGAGLGLLACGALAALGQLAPPATLTPAPADGPGRVDLDWPAAAGATSYNVKRSPAAGGPHALLANVATTHYSDATATGGVTYFYAVTSVSNGSESASFREVASAPGCVVDNGDTGSVAATGSWPLSTLTNVYGADSQYAATTAGGSPTATFRMTPHLPCFAHYDIYLRWPAYANRATNAPVDVWYADGQRDTVTLDQTGGSNTWVLLGTFPCPSGTLSSVEVRNNTGAAGDYVGVDAVQFVPRLSPWGPRADALEDYTVSTFSDECSGTSLNTSRWALALGRTNVSVGGGKISLDIGWVGDTPVGSADTNALRDPLNWNKGAVRPVHDHKYGYYEARFRVVQAGGGVDCAFWMPDRGGLLPWEGYELDSPEVFPDDLLADTDMIYGMWDHRGGSPPWRMNALHLDHDWAVRFHVYGMEWRTDNTLVHYLDGVKLFTAPASAINSIGSMAPADVDLSCYVGNYWQPAAAIDGQSMKVDFLRCYAKPGWTGGGGAAVTTWGDARNWGPDGIPGAGEAAVFNLPATQAVVSILGQKSVHSLCFDGAVSSMSITGAYKIQLGAGGNSIEQGGICMGSAVTNDQTIAAPLEGLQNLSFINNSLSGAALVLDGAIDGTNGGARRRIHFGVNAPIIVGRPLGSWIGDVIKWGPVSLALPSNSAHAGRTLLAQGTVEFNHAADGGLPSGLGAASASATNLLFYPRTKHTSEAHRPRLRYTGPAAGTDRGLTLGYFCDGILEASGSGPIAWTGPLIFDAGNTATAILEFGGTNADRNSFAGRVSDAGAVNPSGDPVSLKVRKSGAGRWVLSGTNAWTGTTEISAGELVLNGSLSNSAAVTVLVGGTLSGRGSVLAPTLIQGTLSPGDPAGAMRFNSLTFGNYGQLRWSLASNAIAGAGSVTAAVLVVTNGAKVKLVLDGAGSSVDFRDDFWRSPRTWAAASGVATGTFALGTVSADAGGRPAGDYGAFSLAQVSGIVSVAWSPLTGYALYAAQIPDAAARAAGNDSDGDGFPNLLEYVTGGSPTNPDAFARLALEFTGGVPRLVFLRNTNGADATLVVEGAGDGEASSWVGLATNRSGSWGGATNVLESGTGTPVRVHVGDASGTNRQLRLRVTTP